MGLGVIKAPLDNPIRTTAWTQDAIGPSQVSDRFKTLGIIDEILDIEHGGSQMAREEERKHHTKNKGWGLSVQGISPESI
tara:strand:+ start:647 stop:886 length:240 start_codon:yes stop_codon:yes gene_type:complete